MKTARRFIAIDGEGKTDADGTHRYTLLAASTGEYLQGANLSTRDCFNFLLNLAIAHPRATFVGFFTAYDVNMIARDLCEKCVLPLLANAQKPFDLLHGGAKYRIQWIPRKSFYLARYRGKYRNAQKRRDVDSIRWWDVFGFFQAAFAKVLPSWFEPGSPFLADLDRIVRMKAERANFGSETDEDILAYCRAELRALVALCERVDEYARAVNVDLKRYDGAGAIASALLRREGVEAHKADLPPEVGAAAMRAYAGGRVESMAIGRGGPVWFADIASAYPWALTLARTMQGEWVYQNLAPLDRWFLFEDSSLYRVRFDFPEGLPWYPLFYRNQKGEVTIPPRGEGWYFGCEVRAAVEWAQINLGDHYFSTLYLREAYLFKPSSKVHPFAFLREVYEQRRKLKSEGHGAEKILKLGMNAMYGKLASTIGHEGRPPRWYSMYWAGFTTAMTRARLVRACMRQPKNVLFFATDGIAFRTEPTLPLGGPASGLGSWEITKADELILAQPGVYWHRNGDTWTAKFRGFGRELTREAVLGAWAAGAHEVKVPITRFMGIGASLATDMKLWRRWITATRTLNLTGDSPKRRPRGEGDPLAGFLPLAVRGSAQYDATGELSAPYDTVKWGVDPSLEIEERTVTDMEDGFDGYC